MAPLANVRRTSESVVSRRQIARKHTCLDDADAALQGTMSVSINKTLSECGYVKKAKKTENKIQKNGNATDTN